MSRKKCLGLLRYSTKDKCLAATCIIVEDIFSLEINRLCNPMRIQDKETSIGKHEQQSVCISLSV